MSFQSYKGHSAAATAIVSVQAATGSIHANLLMSGLLPPQPNDISIGQQDIDTPLAPITTNNLVSNEAPTYPLEVKFESKDELTGETRTITEDLTLSSINNVIIQYLILNIQFSKFLLSVLICSLYKYYRKSILFIRF